MIGAKMKKEIMDLPRQLIIHGDSASLTLRNNYDWLLVNLEENFTKRKRLQISFTESLGSPSSNWGKMSGGQISASMCTKVTIP